MTMMADWGIVRLFVFRVSLANLCNVNMYR